MISSFSLSDIDCRVYLDGKPETVFYWGTAKGHTDMEAVLKLIKEGEGKNFLLCTFEANDWNDDFSPWEAPPVFGKEGFSGKGIDTLVFLKSRLIPYIEICYPEAVSARKVIAGYSLAGLFSLWAALTGNFDNAISCSGSLWFPGWTDFLEKTALPSSGSEFYISLGDKESKTKNKVMASVEANTLKTVEYLKTKSSCTFEWNQGGHFNGSEERMAKAFISFLHSRK